MVKKGKVKSAPGEVKGRDIKVGLIGCGRIAAVHADAISKNEGMVLGAVCDVVEERMLRFSEKYGVPGYADFHTLLRKEKPDLVAIATPNGTHYAIARACMEHGTDILLEKPITITNKEADDLITLSGEKGVRFFAVKQVRYNPAIRVLKSAVQAGYLGKLFSTSLVVRWTRPQEYFEKSEWRGTRFLDGGGLLNQGIHYVDVMQWILGDVEKVFGKKDTCCHKIEIEDMAFGLLGFKSGVIGTVEFTVNTFPHNLECSLAVLGDQGTVKLAGQAMNEIEIWHVKDLPKPAVPEGFPPYIYEGGLYQGSCPNHYYVYQDIMKNFNGISQEIVDGKEAAKSLKIVNALYRSADTGREVRL